MWSTSTSRSYATLDLVWVLSYSWALWLSCLFSESNSILSSQQWLPVKSWTRRRCSISLRRWQSSNESIYWQQSESSEKCISCYFEIKNTNKCKGLNSKRLLTKSFKLLQTIWSLFGKHWSCTMTFEPKSVVTHSVWVNHFWKQDNRRDHWPPPYTLNLLTVLLMNRLSSDK